MMERERRMSEIGFFRYFRGVSRDLRVGETFPHALLDGGSDVGVTVRFAATGRRKHYSWANRSHQQTPQSGSVNELLMALCEETGVARANMTLMHCGRVLHAESPIPWHGCTQTMEAVIAGEDDP
eukprot:SAG31_NODE_18524_length_633_cov_0.758427_1_plen_124_part_01